MTKLTSKAWLVGAVLATAMATGVQAVEVTASYVTGTLDGMVPQIAKGEGIFKKHGLDVTLLAVRTGSEMVSAVASGSAKFAAPAPIITIPAIEKGGDITFLMNNYDLDYSLLAKPNVGIDPKAPYPDIVKPLKGKRIGVAGRGGLTEVYIRKIFSDAGLDPDKDLNVIVVGAGVTALAAFQNDQIDALTTLPPNDIIMKPEEYVTVVSVDTSQQKVFGPNFITTAVIAGGPVVRNTPDVVKSYCSAILDTIRFMQGADNKKKVAGYFAKSLNLTEPQAEAVFERYGKNYNPILTKTRWDELRKARPATPAWETGVFAPCAEMTSK